MHDIFQLPAEGYPQELLPIRQEIVNRTATGHIDSAYEMYQYELSRLRELGIPVFELPREHFELERQYRWPDSANEQPDTVQLVARISEIQLAAGIPAERVTDPQGAGLPAPVRDSYERIRLAIENRKLDGLKQLIRQWIDTKTRYGLLDPALDYEPDPDEAQATAESQAQRESLPAYTELQRAMAQALFRGSIDEVLEHQEKLLELSEQLSLPFTRLPREFFELQHLVSQAARRNDYEELARLQEQLQQLDIATEHQAGMFEDPSGIMGLPPAYARLALACEEAFRRGDPAAAMRLGQQMQDLQESSASIFKLINMSSAPADPSTEDPDR